MKLQLQAFAHRSHFSAPQGSENTTQLAKYPPVFYVKPWNKCFPWQFSGNYCHRDSSIFSNQNFIGTANTQKLGLS